MINTEMTDNRKDVCMIMAGGKKNYVRNGYESVGVKTIIPYYDYNIFLRICREIWFRLRLPGKSLWFNKKIKGITTEAIYIRNPLIIPEFVEWVCDIFPDKPVIFEYSNRVSTASTVPTDVSRPNLKFISYDGDDCEQYHMEKKSPTYFECYRFSKDDKKEPEYDIIYLGRDKGRAKALFELQAEFERNKLKTYFHICADRSFLRFRKKYYKPEMDYKEYIELLKRTKSHLNIVPDGQTSITQRELESVFDEVKCITNNRGILEFDLYDPSRYFVLGIDSISELSDFLNSEFKPIPPEKLAGYVENCRQGIEDSTLV